MPSFLYIITVRENILENAYSLHNHSYLSASFVFSSFSFDISIGSFKGKIDTMASATTKSPHILLLGGHGKVSLLLTPLLLARSWHVTSVVRNADHRKDIEQAAGSENLTKGKLNVLVDSLEEVKSEGDAKGVIEKAGGVDWVVWSAGKCIVLFVPLVIPMFLSIWFSHL